MQLEIFAICDAAADYAGRLTVMGAFEGIAGGQVPLARERCSVAIRMRFEHHESGDHRLALRLLNPDGQLIVPEINAGFTVRFSRDRSSLAVNLVFNLNQLRFAEFGEHAVELWLDDGDVARLPLMIAKRMRRKGSNN